MFLRQASERTIQSLVRPHWLNALGRHCEPVNRRHHNLTFRDGHHRPTRSPRVCGVKAGWLSLAVSPSRPQPGGQFLLARVPGPAEDQARWQAAFKVGDRFDGSGPGSHLAEATRRNLRISYARFLAFLSALATIFST